MSAKQPHEYNKQILVAVTGLTPQVVTETLYCLTVKRKLKNDDNDKPFVPTEILLLTTGAGRKKIGKTLTGKAGWLRKFGGHYGAEFGVGEDAFEAMTKVCEIVDTADVCHTEESKKAANGIVNTIRELIAADKDGKNEIVASIAGGRATM